MEPVLKFWCQNVERVMKNRRSNLINSMTTKYKQEKNKKTGVKKICRQRVYHNKYKRQRRRNRQEDNR